MPIRLAVPLVAAAVVLAVFFWWPLVAYSWRYWAW